MFSILIIGFAVIVGAFIFGLTMLVGAMLYSGKWTIPGTDQRTVRQARVQKEVATLRAETAQQDYFREQINANRDILGAETATRLEAASDAAFQRALESPKSENS